MRSRRWALVVLGIVVATAIAVLVGLLVVTQSSGGRTGVLVGELTTDRIAGLAVTVALGSIAVGLCVIPVPGWWLALLIPARIAAIGAAGLMSAAWWLTSSAGVVPLISDGCETGYVVEEESFLLAGWGTVYRQDGLFITPVARTGGDDGYRPFRDDAYVVVDNGTTLHVWYNSHHSYERRKPDTTTAPAFSLPKLATSDSPTCAAVADPSPEPAPAPTYAPLTFGDAEIILQDMSRRSVAAAVGPVLDQQGIALDVDAVAATSVPCDESGFRLSKTFEFRTADNARSLAQILAVWDEAGYSPDRAMQEDIRYSTTLPVEWMGIRDRTTIDGLIHLTITTACAHR